jgi:hypothetical protein
MVTPQSQTEATAGQTFNAGVMANGSPNIAGLAVDPFAQVARTISVQVLNTIGQILPAVLQTAFQSACDAITNGGPVPTIGTTNNASYVQAGNWKGYILDVVMKGGHNFKAETLHEYLGTAGFKDATSIENLRQWLGRQKDKGVLVKQNDTWKLAPQRH